MSVYVGSQWWCGGRWMPSVNIDSAPSRHVSGQEVKG